MARAGRAAAAVAALVLGGASPASAGALDQEQAGPVDIQIAGQSSFAQTFTAGVSGRLDRVDLGVYRTSASEALQVKVHSTTLSGAPAAVIAVGATEASNVPAAAHAPLTPVTFVDPATLSAGTRYALSVELTPGYGWTATEGNPYAAGDPFNSSNGTDWAQGAGFDMRFRTYMEPLDTDAPETTIDSGPAGATNDSTPTFEFSSDETGSTFKCRIDDGDYETCTSPHTTAELADGAHTFYVRATDAQGNTDPDPATRMFTVDTTPPDTNITAGPSGTTADAAPTFEFTSTEQGSTFECRIDGGDFEACSSPHTTGTLAEGEHTFQVRATDAAGNPEPEPATRTFTVRAETPPPPPGSECLLLNLRLRLGQLEIPICV